ncbi:MAG: lamin tail domain-containing protein [bacterium]
MISANGIIISEVMANPKGGSGAQMPEDRNEFIEVFNAGTEAIDLYNYRIDDGDAIDFLIAYRDSVILELNPNVIIGTNWLRPGGYAVILDPEYTSPEAKGGYIQPYRFGDSTLILTVGNTTIGNGLANNDPIVIFSIYGDTTTFGTPADTTDNLPANAGDGLSWERIDLFGDDSPDNWAVCPDSSGSTPGKQNAVSAVIDVAITGIVLFDSVVPEPGQRFNFGFNVKNNSFTPSPAGTVKAWFSPNDTFLRIVLPVLMPRCETTFAMTAIAPRSRTELWVKALIPKDCDTMNNQARLLIIPGGRKEVLSLPFVSFSPDNDGFEDSLPIFYSLPEPKGALTIQVFDLKGRVVRTIVTNLRCNDFNQGTIYWNGRKDNATLAPAGIYAIFLEYKYSGNKIRAKLPAVLIKK